MIITYYGYYFFGYLLLCLIFSVYFVSKEKSKHKIIDFTIIYWFMTRQIYKSTYAWREFSLLSKFRKTDQFLSWVFFAFVLMSILSANTKKAGKMLIPAYEKFTYVYYFFAMGMLYLHQHLGNIRSSRSDQQIAAYFAAFIMFFSLRYLITKQLVRIMVRSVLFLAVLSGLVSIVQFFGDQKILRLAAYYMAFPGYNRASGIFHWPYDNGIILITGTALTYFFIKKRAVRVTLYVILILGIILTFTRGVWLAGIGIFIFHLFYFNKRMLRTLYMVIPIVTVLSLGFVSAYLYQTEFFTGEAWQERVFKDTVSVRFAFYNIVLNAIPDAWLIGYGDVQNNDVYFKGMVNAGQGMNWSMGRGGGIHNVFLEEVFLRGIFSALFWALSFLTMFYFARKKTIEHKNFTYCFPLYYNMAVFLYCMTVGAFLANRSAYQTIIFFAMLSAIYNKKIHLEEFEFSNVMSIKENKMFKKSKMIGTDGETNQVEFNESKV